MNKQEEEERFYEKRVNLPKMLLHICSDMCDNYCKYPNMISDHDELMEVCEKCPMLKLQ